jgi:hypothetical protein
MRGHAYGVLALLGAQSLGWFGCAGTQRTYPNNIRPFGVSTSRQDMARANTRVVRHESLLSGSGAPTQSQIAENSQPNPEPAPAATQAYETRSVAVDGTDVQAGLVIGEIDAPFALMSVVLTDYVNFRHFLPRIVDSRVVRRRRHETEVYLRAELLENFGVIWAHARFAVTRASDSLRVEGERIDGTLLRFQVRLEAAAITGTNRTRVAVQILGIPSFPLPSGYLTRQHARWTGRAFEALKSYAEARAQAAAQPRAHAVAN